MRDAATFTVDDPRFTTAQVVGPSMLSLDGETHRRHRDPFAAALRRRGSASATTRPSGRTPGDGWTTWRRPVAPTSDATSPDRSPWRS